MKRRKESCYYSKVEPYKKEKNSVTQECSGRTTKKANARSQPVLKEPPMDSLFNKIIALTKTNLIAGSDSTAIGLLAILSFLCKSPTAYTKL